MLGITPPENFHYNAVTRQWDSDSGPGNGVYVKEDGKWYATVFYLGSLMEVGPFGDEADARQEYLEVCEWNLRGD